MTTVLVLPENIFNIEVYSRSTWFQFELNLSKFFGFLWRNPSKHKKVRINYFDKQEKLWIFLKIFQTKNQIFRDICAILDYSKPKLFFVGQPWWPKFFQPLAPSYFSATTVLFWVYFPTLNLLVVVLSVTLYNN